MQQQRILKTVAYQNILFSENRKNDYTDIMTYNQIFQYDYIRNAPYKKELSKQIPLYRDEAFKPFINNNRFLIGNHGTCYDTILKVLLKPAYSGGYIHYYLPDYGVQIAHRMIMLTFEPIFNADEMQVNHKDGIKDHNYWNPNPKLSNLEWVTPQQNVQHAYATGLIPITYGEEKYNAQYTNDEVKKICEMLQNGCSSTEIGKAINKSGYPFLRFIHNLRNGIAWTWMTKDYQLKPAIRHTEDEIIAICELIMTGISDEEISIKLKNDFNYDILPGFIKTIRYGNKNWTPIIQKYDFPSRLNRPYSEYDIHTFCELLERNISFKEIAELTGFDYTHSFHSFLNNLRHKKVYIDIVSQYNISSERKIKEKFTNAEVTIICELLLQGYTAREIANILEIEFNNSIATSISLIKQHKSFTHISNNYDFQKKIKLK